jgi:speckle-type POZ protein
MSFAGVSVIAHGSLQQPSAVYSGTASSSGYHLLVVEGYSRIKHMPNRAAIRSRPFILGGYRWVLSFYPNGSRSESSDFISLILNLDQELAQPVKVHLDFSFIHHDLPLSLGQAPARIRAVIARDFSTGARSWGQHKFMKREALKDDSFIVRYDIIIADPLAPFIEVPSSNMCQHFTKLLETKVGTDVTFMIDGETFVAHRCILAARSPVFMAELFGPMKEGTTDDVIHIKDMEASVFKALLRFIYADSMPKMEEAREVGESRAEAMWLQNLLVAADRYDLQRLKSMCEERLAKHIDLRSVTTVTTGNQSNAVCSGHTAK